MDGNRLGTTSDFEVDKPLTPARSKSEERIEGLRGRGGLFVDAVRATRMPMAVTDPALPGNPIVFANAAFLELSGCSMAEVLGQQPHFMNGAATDPADAAKFREALEQDHDELIESIQYRKDGSRFVAAVFLSAFKGEDGRTVNHFLSYLDVTARVTAEERLTASRVSEGNARWSEARATALAEASSETRYRMSADWGETLELTGDGFLAHARAANPDWLTDYIPVDDQARVTAAIEEAIRSKSLFDLEHRVRLGDGSIGWTHSRAVPILGPDGEILEWFGAANDISDRRDAEERLRESEERHAFLLKLSDALRPLRDPVEVQATTMRLVVEHLGVMRATYLESDPDEDGQTFAARYDRNTARIPEHIRLSDFAPDMLQAYRSGQTLTIEDSEVDAPSEIERAAYRALGVRAGVGVPLVKGGQLLGIFGVHSATPRRWTEAEIRLLEDIADRIWTAVERAHAEGALHESEKRLRALATVGSSSVHRMSADWRDMQEMDGAGFLVDAETSTTNWVDTYIPLDERPRVREAIDRATAGKSVFELEHRVLRADGSVGWTFSRAIPLLDDTGEITEWFGAATDVTARVKADQRFTRLFEASPAPFLVVKPDAPRFTITEVNDAYLTATLRTRESVVGRGIFEAYPDNPEMALSGVGTLRASLDRVLASRRPDTVPDLKYDIMRPDGTFEERWWSPVNSPVFDENGEVEAIIHNANDVTDSRRADAALQAAAARDACRIALTDALRDTPDPIEAQGVAMRLLGEHLEASRVMFGEADKGSDEAFTNHREFRREQTMPASLGPHRWDDFGPYVEAEMRAGRTLVVDDVQNERGHSAEELAAYEAVGIRAYLAVPLLHGQRIVAYLAVNHASVRSWTAYEVALTEETAQRTWAAVERARAEAILREREAELARTQRIGQVASVDVALTDPPTGHRSPEYRRLHGLPPEQSFETHQQWLARLHPDDRDQADREFAAAIESGDGYESEYRIIRQCDGAERWISAKAQIERDPLGKATRLRGAHIDITALKHAEAALRASEERLQQFGEATQDVLWIRDAESFQWEYLTPAFGTIYGLDRVAALRGDNMTGWLELILPEDREHAARSLSRVREGEWVTFEFRIQRPDGGIRWMRDTDFPIKDQAGKVVRIAGIGHDVTDLKAVEERLRRSEERLRLAQDVAHIGMWDWDIATGQVSWSDEHFRLEGYEIGEVEPSYDAWLERIHPDDQASAERALFAARDGHLPYADEFRSLHPDGTILWLSAVGSFFYDERGDPVRMIGTVQDVTERRQWLDRQQVLVAELQHRVRNILTVVRSVFGRTVEAGGTTEDIADHFRGRLDALARTQVGITKTATGDVALEDLIRDELLSVHAGDSPDLIIDGPEVMLPPGVAETLGLAIHELTTNSIKYGALRYARTLRIEWNVNIGDRRVPRLVLRWTEQGVPALSVKPARYGFGSELIVEALPYRLGAETCLEFRGGGVLCTISVPLPEIPETAAGI